MTERPATGTVVPRMARKLVLLAFLLAGCSKGPQADLQSISQARSAAAEWALVNEQAGRGRLNSTYVASMHYWLREELRTASQSLTQPDSRYGEQVRELLRQPDDAAPEALRARAEELKREEDSLESA